MQGAHLDPFIQERYRNDSRFRLEVEYCAERGIKHSEFLDWDLDDQEKAITWLIEERLKCPDCGTRRDETDPKHGGDIGAYQPVTWTCFACKHIEETYESSRFKEGKRKGQLPTGFKVRLVPNSILQERRRLRRQQSINEVASRGRDDQNQ